MPLQTAKDCAGDRQAGCHKTLFDLQRAHDHRMTEINLQPSLAYCIETVAKREYKRILSVILRGKQEDRQLEEELELLKRFLEAADFSQLRSRCEEFLLAGRRVNVRLRSSSGVPEYEIEATESI
jgi:hypothetical protein